MATMTLELPVSPVITAGSARLDFHNLHVIRGKDEYQSAIAVIHALFDKGDSRTTVEDELLEFLSLLVEAYEEANVEMPLPASPQEIVEFLLEQNEMKRADLHKLFGGKARVSEFFSQKRSLSKTQMLGLSKLFKIPVDLLVS